MPFTLQNVDKIAKLIMSLNPGLTDFAYKQIINDLKWVLDPKYAKGKTELELLDTFNTNLISGQRDPVSRTGKDMIRKAPAEAAEAPKKAPEEKKKKKKKKKAEPEPEPEPPEINWPGRVRPEIQEITTNQS